MDSRNESLMVVDDDSGNREALRAALQNEGFSVRVYSDPRSALTAFEDQPADIVISDYQLPVMDGLELMTAIKSRHPDLPFILMTATPGDHVIIGALNRGASAFFHKPLNIAEMIARLNDISIELKRRHRRDQQLQTLKSHYTSLAREVSHLGEIIDNLAVG